SIDGLDLAMFQQQTLLTEQLTLCEYSLRYFAEAGAGFDQIHPIRCRTESEADSIHLMTSQQAERVAGDAVNLQGAEQIM
ncbi:hypothetical protein, partial [Pseudomonas syringae group genomosp. 7]